MLRSTVGVVYLFHVVISCQINSVLHIIRRRRLARRYEHNLYDRNKLSIVLAKEPVLAVKIGDLPVGKLLGVDRSSH